jgi:hypothetical protein
MSRPSNTRINSHLHFILALTPFCDIAEIYDPSHLSRLGSFP